MKVSTNTYKRWMALFLCIVMFTTMLPLGTAFADEFAEEPGTIVDEMNVSAVEEPVEVPEDFAMVEEPVVVPEVQPMVEEPVEVSEVPAMVEELVEVPEVPAVVEEPVEVPEIPAMVEEPVVVPEVQPIVEEPVVASEIQPVMEEPATLPEAPAAEPEVLPVKVVFISTPSNATVSVYTKDAFGTKQPINAEWDGSYLLLPGSYFYTVNADGYNAVDETVLLVAASVIPLEVYVAMSSVMPAVEAASTETTEGAEPAANAESDQVEDVKAEEENAGDELIAEAEEETKAIDPTDLDITSSKVTLSSVAKSGNGLKVTWAALTGAEKYRVYRKGPGDSNWVKQVETTAVSYTDTNVESGKTYTYFVRAFRGSTYSLGSAQISAIYWKYNAPTISSVTTVDTGLKITWNAVAGTNAWGQTIVLTYTIQRKAAGDVDWVTLGNTNSTSYTDKQVVEGGTYHYRVRVKAESAYSSVKSGTFYGKAVLSSVQNTYRSALKKGVVQLTWSPVNGMVNFKIQRKLKDAPWDAANTKNLAIVATQPNTVTYLDQDVASNTSYTYRIIGLDASKKAIGTYDKTGKSITFFDTPELDQDPAITAKGVNLSWHPVTGVSLYRVLRKASGESLFTKLADVKTTSYTDTTVAAGQSYTYSVRCLSNDGKKIISGYDTVGVTVSFTNTPVLLKAEPGQNGLGNDCLVFTWKPVTGALYYQVFRKTKDSNWEKAGPAQAATTNDPEKYEDTVPTSYTGTKFYYTVRVVKAATGDEYTSFYDETGVGATYFPAVQNVKVTAVPEGVNIAWDQVPGAPYYRIFRRPTTPGGKWTNAGATSKLTFTDNGAKLTSGIEYEYKVVVLDSDKEIASLDSALTAQSKLFFYSVPKMLKVENRANGLEVSWEQVANITVYNVYRKTANSNWQALPTPLTITVADEICTFVDTSCTTGVTYTYTVACADGVWKDISGYDPVGITETFYAINFKVTKCVNGTAGIQVTWEPVDKINLYHIYRREKDTNVEAFKMVGSSKTNTFMDKQVKDNHLAEYTYSVKCVDDQGKEVGDYAQSMTKQRFITPTLKDVKVVLSLTPPVTTNKGRVNITWNAVGSVSKYNVYRRKNSDGWQKIATVTGTQFTDIWSSSNNMASGATYSYAVTCASSSGANVSAKSAVKSVIFLYAPDLKTVERTASGVLVGWSAVPGAAGYKVYRKLDGGSSWSLVKTVSSYSTLTWTDTSVLSGSTYSYTVCAYKGSSLSGRDNTGLTITALDRPTITSTKNINGGVELTRSSVPNATGYQYRYRLANGTWSDWKPSATTWVSANPIPVTGTHGSGVKYEYQIRAVSNATTPLSCSVASPIVTHIYYDQPTVPNVNWGSYNSEYTTRTIKVSWSGVPGASKYRVYRQTNGGSWTKLADVSGTSYNDTKAAVGKTYAYSVACINGSGTVISSRSAASADMTVAYKFAAPSAPTATATTGTITVKWTAISGVGKYRVQRKTLSGSWTTIGTSTTNSYKDTTTTKGVYYLYRVVCVNSGNTACISPYGAASAQVLAK